MNTGHLNSPVRDETGEGWTNGDRRGDTREGSRETATVTTDGGRHRARYDRNQVTKSTLGHGVPGPSERVGE